MQIGGSCHDRLPPRKGKSMIILNFTYPLTPEQIAQIEALTAPAYAGAGQPIAQTIEIPTQFDNEKDFVAQVVALADVCGLTPVEWQTTPQSNDAANTWWTTHRKETA